MTKKFSKAMLERVSALTKLLFSDSVKEVMGIQDESNDDDLQMIMDMLRHAKDYEGVYSDEEIADMLKKKVQVDDLYLQKMLSLSTTQLEEIMVVHDNGNIKRMAKTVEAILSELASRTILNDTSESDTKYNNGDVDELKIKSKTSSK